MSAAVARAEQFRRNLDRAGQLAYKTIPHDLRGRATVQKADEDQAHAERVAEGEEDAHP